MNPKVVKIIKRIVIILVILLIVGLGIFLFLKYRETKKNNAKELMSLLGWVGYTRQCQKVISEAQEPYASMEEFEGFVRECKENTSKTLEGIKSLKGYNRSSEFSSSYDELVSASSDLIVSGEALDKDLELYKIWHKWILDTDSMDYFQIDDDIDKMVSPLIESGNETLASFGKEWAVKRKELLRANMLLSASPDDDFFRGKYRYVLSDYNSYNREQTPDIDSITMIGIEKDTVAFRRALVRVKKYIGGSV